MFRQIPIAKRTTSAMWQAIRSATVETDGAALVEFTLFATMLVVMCIYIMDFGFYFFRSMQVQNAAQAGAQYVIDNSSTGCPASSSSTQIESAVTNATPFNVTAAATLYYGCASSSSPYTLTANGNGSCTTAPPNCGDGFAPACYWKVSATGTYNTFVPYGLLSNGSYTFTKSTWVRCK
jgi:Flp pilus assembly protein TadG